MKKKPINIQTRRTNIVLSCHLHYYLCHQPNPLSIIEKGMSLSVNLKKFTESYSSKLIIRKFRIRLMVTLYLCWPKSGWEILQFWLLWTKSNILFQNDTYVISLYALIFLSWKPFNVYRKIAHIWLLIKDLTQVVLFLHIEKIYGLHGHEVLRMYNLNSFNWFDIQIVTIVLLYFL